MAREVHSAFPIPYSLLPFATSNPLVLERRGGAADTGADPEGDVDLARLLELSVTLTVSPSFSCRFRSMNIT